MKHVVVKDVINIYELSTNKEMEGLKGKKAKVISEHRNAYDDKIYYRLDVDQGRNIWSKEMLSFI